MGCVECKICHQSEEQNQFEYPQTSPKKPENHLNNENNPENQEIQENQDINNIGFIPTSNYNTEKDKNPQFITNPKILFLSVWGIFFLIK